MNEMTSRQEKQHGSGSGVSHYEDVWMEEWFMMDAGLGGAVGEFPCFDAEEPVPVHSCSISSPSPIASRPARPQARDHAQDQAAPLPCCPLSCPSSVSDDPYSSTAEELRQAWGLGPGPQSCSTPPVTQARLITPDGTPRLNVQGQGPHQFSKQGMLSTIAPPPLSTRCVTRHQQQQGGPVSHPHQHVHAQQESRQAATIPCVPILEGVPRHQHPVYAPVLMAGQPASRCLDYVDYAGVPEQYQVSPLEEERLSCIGGVQCPFPERLHDMLTQCHEKGFSDIVNWASHGRCFVVRLPKLFQEEVLALYFNQTKYRSFQRQLNLYGFKRITGGADRGGYYHPLMLRGRRKLSARMRRLKPTKKAAKKGNGAKGSSPISRNAVFEPEMEPNFYAMTSVGGEPTTRHLLPYRPAYQHTPTRTGSMSTFSEGGTAAEAPSQGTAALLKIISSSHTSPLTAALFCK